MIQYLAITAMGTDEPGIANQIMDIICHHQCQLELTSMNKMGTEFTISLLVSGNRNSVIKLEAMLNEFGHEADIHIITKQISDEVEDISNIPYIVQIITAYEPTVLERVTHFFADEEINIREITAARYVAQQTGTEMLNAQLLVDIPTDMSISDLRESFTDFCNEINVDASLEPDKL